MVKQDLVNCIQFQPKISIFLGRSVSLEDMEI